MNIQLNIQVKELGKWRPATNSELKIMSPPIKYLLDNDEDRSGKFGEWILESTDFDENITDAKLKLTLVESAPKPSGFPLI